MPEEIGTGSSGGGSGGRGRSVLYATLLLIICLGALLFFLHFGALNADEGFYGLASRAVMDGAMPYRDFGFSQTPFVPYINGAVMKMVGFGFLEQRAVNVLWAVCALVIGFLFLLRRGNPRAAVTFGLLMVSSLGWLSFCAKGKTYALTGLFLMLMGVGGLSTRPGIGRVLAVLIPGVLAIGCRLPVLPVVALAVVGLMFESGSYRRALGIGLAGISLVGIGLYPFASSDWPGFVFWNLDFHLRSEAVRDLAFRLRGFAAVSLPVWIVGFAILSMQWRLFRLSDFRTWLIVGLVLTVVFNLGSVGGYGEYAVPLVPLSAVLVAGPLTVWLGMELRRVRVWVTVVVLATGLLLRPDLDFEVSRDVEAMASLLRQTVPMTDEIFGSSPVVALESGHRFPAPFLMGKFAVTEDLSDREAARVHMLTPDSFATLLESETLGAVVLSVWTKWNFAWSAPSYRVLSRSGSETISGALDAHFEPTYTTDRFVAYLRKGWSDRSISGVEEPGRK